MKYLVSPQRIDSNADPAEFFIIDVDSPTTSKIADAIVAHMTTEADELVEECDNLGFYISTLGACQEASLSVTIVSDIDFL